MTQAEDDPQAAEDEALFHTQWRSGRLRFLLDANQQRGYDLYRKWEAAAPPATKPNQFPRVFVMEAGKRVGKTSLCLWLKAEDCIRRPGTVHRYASAFQASIAEIVGEVADEVFATAPEDCRPVYHGKYGAFGPCFVFPVQPGARRPSIIRLVGVDLHPNSLRGLPSDGDVFSECGFMTNLLYVVKNVVYHQYQGRPHARLILESSAPRVLDTDWERIFLPDARYRKAIWTATLADNPRLSPAEREEFEAAAGGRGDPDCEAEYYNTIAVPPRSRVVPDFDVTRHVADWPRPAHAHCYHAADPGSRDLFGQLWGYWDFSRAALVVEQEWAEVDPVTDDVARAIRTTDAELWGTPDTSGGPIDRLAYRQARHAGVGVDVELVDRWLPQVGAPEGVLTYFDGQWLRANPYKRTADIDLRLCADLGRSYGIQIEPIRKDSLEAMVAALRSAFVQGHVIVHPRCVRLIGALLAARWDKNRVSWDRDKTHGHFDLLAALVYLWRMVDSYRHLNPNPPYRPTVAKNAEVVDSLPWQQNQAREDVGMFHGLMGIEGGKPRPGTMKLRR